MLVLVPTPIGNLEDVTMRALRVLREAAVVACEDTRTTGVLMQHYGIATPRTSFHVHNEHGKAAQLVARMQAGETVALVSDAGTPGISDPGFLLVRAAVEAGVRVEALPGPTAFVPALVASGLPCDRFVYEGFLPHKKGRQTRLKEIAAEPRTTVLYESPHRLARLLGELANVEANVLDVVHERTSTTLHLDVVEVALQVETRGGEHAARVLARLRE